MRNLSKMSLSDLDRLCHLLDVVRDAASVINDAHYHVEISILPGGVPMISMSDVVLPGIPVPAPSVPEGAPALVPRADWHLAPAPAIEAAVDAAFATVLPGYDLTPAAEPEPPAPVPEPAADIRLPADAAPSAQTVARTATIAPPVSGKPLAWTAEEDARLVEIVAAAVHDGVSKWKASAAAAAALGRPVEGTKFRMNTKLSARIDARVAELAAGAASPMPLPMDIQGHLRGLPRDGIWTLKRDADLMHFAGLGWKNEEIAIEIDVSADKIKKRFDLLTGYDPQAKVRTWSRDAVAAALDGMMAQAMTPQAAE